MSLLLYAPPESVIINGKQYPINTDFRTGIRFEQIMLDGAIEAANKMRMLFDLWFPESKPLPAESNMAMEAVASFYLCDKETEAKEDTEAGDGQRYYDFDFDANYIIAAFWQQYRIDLTQAKMHWWKFRALFDGLTDETTFVKIMGYRSAEITKDMPDAEKARIRELKKIYALPLPKEEIEDQAEINRILMGDGNISAYLARRAEDEQS